LRIFAAAAALLVGQRSMKDILPPRALLRHSNLQQRTRSLSTRWVLGLDFERAAQEVLKKIVSAPERWPAGKYGTKHYLMQRFPFVIHYLDMPDRIWVVAFAHTSQKPN
jgi:hypothetical protein